MCRKVWAHTIQTVPLIDKRSTAVGILRTIKLFGWERKMSERIRERRDEELSLVWRRRILAVISETVK